MREASHERSEPDIDDLVIEYLERPNDGKRIDAEEILLAHPDNGPAILHELRSYLDLGCEDELEPRMPLGTIGDYTLRRRIGRGGNGYCI